jgi:FkbM family methyltransferase
MKVNAFDRCVIVQAAVSDRAGIARLTDDTASCMARLANLRADQPELNRGSATLQVSTTTLDEQSAIHGVPDVVKIDIEGAELLALRGAERLLRERKPVLLVEVHTEEISREFYPLLERYGYCFHRLDGTEITDRSYVRFVMAR